MAKKWFQLPEQGAGVKRLILTKHIYQIFGELPVRIIAFFVALSVFCKSKERRNAAKKFFKHIKKRFVTVSSLILFVNYANAAVDKFLSFLDKLSPDIFVLDKPEDFSGTFFITTHIGNIEILRSLLSSTKYVKPKRVNIFMQASSCKIFNNFLKTLEIKTDTETFAIEEINPETSIMISERLQNGEIVFMAGDRISAQAENRTFEADFLGQKVQFPIGTFRFAQIINAKIYFIVCAKEGRKYKVFTQKFLPNKEKRSENLEELCKQYVEFLEKFTRKYPYQFYNFFDLFTND